MSATRDLLLSLLMAQTRCEAFSGEDKGLGFIVCGLDSCALQLARYVRRVAGFRTRRGVGRTRRHTGAFMICPLCNKPLYTTTVFLGNAE